MEQHLNYITLGVADLAASRRFYRETFGWQERDDSNDNIAFFQTGSALILALFPRKASIIAAFTPSAVFFSSRTHRR